MSISKREYKRYPLTGTAEIKPLNTNATLSIDTLIANISKVGLGLYSTKPLDLKTEVSITLSFISIHGTLHTEQIDGYVINTKKIGSLNFLGIAFHDEIDQKRNPVLFEHYYRIINWD